MRCVPGNYLLALQAPVIWPVLKTGLLSLKFPLPNARFASVYATRGANRIGRVYKKAIFRQFTDDTYSQEIPKAAWLGFLGPVLKAEEEDVFIIHLKNFASRPYSVHPHGVFYDKDSEGKVLAFPLFFPGVTNIMATSLPQCLLLLTLTSEDFRSPSHKLIGNCSWWLKPGTASSQNFLPQTFNTWDKPSTETG